MRNTPVLVSVIWCTISICVLSGQKPAYIIALPKVGDVHYYKMDNLPDQINLNLENNRKVWNLTTLSSPTANEYPFKAATESMFAIYFPGATLVSYDLRQNERFYKRIGNTLFLIGEVQKSGHDKVHPIVKKYSDAKPMYTSELTSGKEDSYQTKWETVFNGSELGKKGVDATVLYKLETTEDNEETVSQPGTVYLPTEQYPAMYLMRNVFSTFKWYKQIGTTWKEISPTEISNVPLELEESRTEVYFFNEKSQEWIAELRLNAAKRVVSAMYKSDANQVKSRGNTADSEFYLYPNPTFGVIRMDFANMSSGTYTLEIYNIIGKKLWANKYAIQGYTTIREDLRFLNRGTYLYSIADQRGHKLLTRRLAVITP